MMFSYFLSALFVLFISIIYFNNLFFYYFRISWQGLCHYQFVINQCINKLFLKLRPIFLTRKKMECCWRRYFPTTLPVSVSLSSCLPEYNWKRHADGTLHIQQNQDKGYIIPFLKSLKQFLSIKSVYEATLNCLNLIDWVEMSDFILTSGMEAM